MHDPQTLTTDYLIIGSGTAGLAFADTRLKEQAAAAVGNLRRLGAQQQPAPSPAASR